MEVTTIIPAYNASLFVTKAVDSVLAQDSENMVIVIDDCSTDDTWEVLKKYSDNARVRLLKNEHNLGVAETRNKGLSLAETPYVAFLDADDFWKEGKLEAQLKLIKETDASLVCTARELFASEGKSTGRTIGVADRVTRNDLLHTNSVACGSVLIKRERALEFGFKYSKYHEDYILWLKVTEKYGPAAGINEPYLCTRLSPGGKSRNKIKSAFMQYGSYRMAGIGFFRRIPLMFSYMFSGLKKYYG